MANNAYQQCHHRSGQNEIGCNVKLPLRIWLYILFSGFIAKSFPMDWYGYKAAEVFFL